MLAVGRRVFVHCLDESAVSVVLTDEGGTVARSSLADGVAVEVLAWRPRGSAGTRYRVRAGRDGVDGWLPAANLRTAAARPVVPMPSPPRESAPEPGVDGRRFGQRAGTHR